MSWCCLFDAIDLGSNLPFAKFFLPFQILYHIRKAFIFNKNEGQYRKVENKVSGTVRVGVVRAYILPKRWHPFNNLN